MINEKLGIKRLVLKSACAEGVDDFFDPFASFYILPILMPLEAQPLMLVDGTFRWINHTVNVSYNNTRQMCVKEYEVNQAQDFELHLHLIQQKESLVSCWQQIQEQFKEALVEVQLSTTDFESYPLAKIAIPWVNLEEMKYENEQLIIELCKKKCEDYA